MAKRLRQIAKTIRELTWSETYDLAHELRDAVAGRQEDPDMDFRVDSTIDWMDLLQSWAEGELDK